MKQDPCLVVLAAVLLCFTYSAFAQDAKTPKTDDLAAADRLYQAGKFGDAIAKYQQALKVEPKLVPAQAGLVRAYLRDDKVDAAFELAKSSLAVQSDSALLLVAMGAVQYRRGEIPESEASFLSARKLDPTLVQSYLGLAQVFQTALLYRRAYDQIKRAHEIAPQDPEDMFSTAASHLHECRK
jgi:tetratricopeptide (TPR) repeat protein